MGRIECLYRIVFYRHCFAFFVCNILHEPISQPQRYKKMCFFFGATEKCSIFVRTSVSEQMHDAYAPFMGLFGFDSGMKWYVSTRRLVGYLLNLSGQKINWRKQLRSRCLIEAQ